ncbi:hypothetical protein PIB30_026841 [Stylosanthes scabra]|uniref:Uncharacterized protein n=1 Tax=Stylosanthes scabra TaxID=79078 RepID=A0ABU6RB19_9FABA|nr:hypothetical protein [Stylosanthes scabra]
MEKMAMDGQFASTSTGIPEELLWSRAGDLTAPLYSTLLSGILLGLFASQNSPLVRTLRSPFRFVDSQPEHHCYEQQDLRRTITTKANSCGERAQGLIRLFFRCWPPNIELVT